MPRNRVKRRLTETLRPVHNLHIVEAVEPHHLAQTSDRIQWVVPERFVQFETVCRRLRLLLRGELLIDGKLIPPRPRYRRVA